MAHTGLTLLLLAREECFVLSCCWEGREGGKEGPFFIILRYILICTSHVVSVMDDTEGKITAQEAQQRRKKIKEIQQGLKTAHCDAAS